LTEFTSPYGLNAQQGWHTSISKFSLHLKNIISLPTGLGSFFTATQFVTKGNSNKKQNLTLTEAIPL